MSRLDNQNVKLSAVFSFSVNRRTWQLAAPTDRTTNVVLDDKCVFLDFVLKNEESIF